jgi:hypothetical protein
MMFLNLPQHILQTSIRENAQQNTATNETLIRCKKKDANLISELPSTDEILVDENGCDRSIYFVSEASDNSWISSYFDPWETHGTPFLTTSCPQAKHISLKHGEAFLPVTMRFP